MSGQGADELRIRGLLIKQGVGPDATTPASIPPKPATRPRDWLDDLLDANATPAPTVEEAAPEAEPAPEPAPAAPPTVAKPKKPKAQTARKRRNRRKQHDPHAARSAWDSQPPAPRQSLIEAWDRVPYRLKWLAYHASAAYLGWSMGLVGWATYVTAWIARTGLVGPQAIFWYVIGALTLLLHHRARPWWPPVAWLAAVPASSVVVGVLLYGTPNP